MNQRQLIQRKLMYVGGMIVLLICIALVSQPAIRIDNEHFTTGGQLAALRTKYKLSQTSLGEIDPTSETMKLATLGLQGVAADILWVQANEYKMKEDWDGVGAAVEQIIKLQPNFIHIWDFQAHNLSYNISVEFDDYRDRYWWVMRGINFLLEGTKYNENEPKLYERLGWNLSQKLGKSDERVQFRRLFRADDDFIKNKGRDPKNRDGWLEGAEYFQQGEDLIDNRSAVLHGMSPLIFFSQQSMALINYGVAIEKEGVFGAEAKRASARASREWDHYSSREIPSSFGLKLKLGEKEQNVHRADELAKRIAEVAPSGTFESLRLEKRAALTKEERALLEISPEKRNIEQQNQVALIEDKITPTNEELVAHVVDAGQREQAARWASEAAICRNVATWTQNSRGIVNYDYWQIRCLAEPLDETLAAREKIYLAGKAYAAVNFAEAKKYYQEGFDDWKVVLDKFPILKGDSTLADDLADEIDRYHNLLVSEFPAEFTKVFPKQFPLQYMLDLSNATNPERLQRQQRRAAAAAKAAEKNGK